MGYVAVRGGEEAIEASLDLLEWQRAKAGHHVDEKDILNIFPDLVDQIMSESSLYAPELAALALDQAQGSPEEAVFLLRAFRSTLERPHTSITVEPGSLHVNRRISAAFKDIPGGQVLGATRDYSHRLIKKNKKDTAFWQELQKEIEQGRDSEGEPSDSDAYDQMPKVTQYLRDEGLLEHYPFDNTKPLDITMEPLTFPAARSARLQTLTRGMTQAVNALGYAAIRGFGPAHPTVAELRYGTIEIAIRHPLEDESDNNSDAYYVGAIPVTEVESLFEAEAENTQGEKELSFDVGYGMVMGRNETKAIAMSVLDNCLSSGDKRYPTQDEEFVLYHIDSIESSGFISHLKLPHYVTFQSTLNSVRKTRASHASNEQQNIFEQEVTNGTSL